MTKAPRDTLDPPLRQGARPNGSGTAGGPGSAVGVRAEWLEILQAPARERVTVTEVCRRYQVSRKSYYSYLARYRQDGVAGLAPRSSRPKTLPARTPADIEDFVVRLRLIHPGWGARRIRTELVRSGSAQVPALSTVHAILRRNGLVGVLPGAATHMPRVTGRPTTEGQTIIRSGGNAR
ncbi:helix-turn-helix domain-containing protein [Nocardia neocaledoniensis]|uniref:helix-turn-helix domain-containing protein n=1 Tax=Nocardia neocaledoniensis TaxID=236511 RepID=UPI002458A774|nr:helix-turn-helix domain-containing protein [Nocardia neocaledoniensis]